jgi:hypothetical protein
MNIVRKHTEALLTSIEEDDIEADAEIAKRTSPSCRYISGENHNISTANISFENMAKFKYFWMAVTNTIWIHKEIYEQINFGECPLRFSFLPPLSTFCGLFYDTSRYADYIESNVVMIDESWIRNNFGESCRGITELLSRNFWKDWRKPRKLPVTTVPAEIRNKHLSNTSIEL